VKGQESVAVLELELERPREATQLPALGVAALRRAARHRVHDRRRLGVAVHLRGLEQELVVVAQDAGAAQVGQSRQHLVRSRAQRGHVAQADQPIHASHAELAQHRLQGHEVAVQVGDQGKTHPEILPRGRHVCPDATSTTSRATARYQV
jgi:hypothetical protein